MKTKIQHMVDELIRFVESDVRRSLMEDPMDRKIYKSHLVYKRQIEKYVRSLEEACASLSRSYAKASKSAHRANRALRTQLDEQDTEIVTLKRRPITFVTDK